MKITAFSLLAFFALPLLSYSQTTTSKHRLAFSAAPNVSFHATTQPIRESPLLGGQLRVDGELKIIKRLWLRIGVGWAAQRYRTDLGNVLQWPSQNNGNGGFDPNLPGENVEIYTLEKMLVLPIALRYFLDKKQRFYTDIESGANLVFVKDGQDELRPILGVVAGWQGHISPKTWFFVQPAARMAFKKGLSTGFLSYSRRPCNLGLELGIRQGL